MPKMVCFYHYKRGVRLRSLLYHQLNFVIFHEKNKFVIEFSLEDEPTNLGTNESLGLEQFLRQNSHREILNRLDSMELGETNKT